jgi:hypothetical protein
VSMLASFHLVSRDRLGALLDAAQPVRSTVREKVLFFSRTRVVETLPLWDWLAANARELEDLPFSGMFLIDLELLADASAGGVLSAGMKEPSAALSQRTGSTFAVFDAEHARRTLTAVDDLDLSPERVREHLLAEHGEAGADDIQSVVDARDWLRAALGQVTSDTLGVLNVG